MGRVAGNPNDRGPDSDAGSLTYRIIIPTIWEAPELLNALLNELNAQGVKKEHLFVISEGSFAENCNRGAAGATEDILIFLNDDTMPHVGWLPPLLDAFNDREVGVAGARLLYPDGRIQHAGVWFDAPGGILTAHNELEDLESGDVDCVTGACLAIRRELFVACDGFDENYRNGYEDVDLCLRVRTGGWRIRYVAESTLTHYESQSGPERWRYVHENVQRLQELWNVREAWSDPEATSDSADGEV